MNKLRTLPWIIKSGKPFPLQSEGDVTTEEWSKGCHIAGFEDRGMGPGDKGCKRPLESRKGKETFSLSVSRKESSSAHIFILA